MALVLDRQLQARLSEAIRGRAVMTFCRERWEVTLRLASTHALVVFTECQDAMRRSVLPLVERIRRDFPSVPVVAYVVPGRTPSSEILAFARAGVHALVMGGFDDGGLVLRAAIENAIRSSAEVRVLSQLGALIPREVEPFVRFCLSHAAEGPTVADAARFLSVHPKTLVYRLRQAGLPTPRAMIGWCRLFVAARLLEDPGGSVASVALQLDFASSSALRGMLWRYARLRPQELRGLGGLDELIRRFTATIGQSPRLGSEHLLEHPRSS